MMVEGQNNLKDKDKDNLKDKSIFVLLMMAMLRISFKHKGIWDF